METVECRFVDGPKDGRRENVTVAHDDGRLPATLVGTSGRYSLYAGHTWSDGKYSYRDPEYRWFEER